MRTTEWERQTHVRSRRALPPFWRAHGPALSSTVFFQTSGKDRDKKTSRWSPVLSVVIVSVPLRGCYLKSHQCPARDARVRAARGGSGGQQANGESLRTTGKFGNRGGTTGCRGRDSLEGRRGRLVVLASTVAVEVISSWLWARISVKHGTLRDVLFITPGQTYVPRDNLSRLTCLPLDGNPVISLTPGILGKQREAAGGHTEQQQQQQR
ncbi:hypothetical protein O3P69_020466 [Scylla paramamosain]|uniref:Uncharacterized protein n=1 Tax=Scylla paramamosain TaxID=85552 RepID=A0AAW0TM32_SCYPA